MARRLTTVSLSLPDVLRSRRSFVLPATQRAYGWGEHQLDRLFADGGYVLAHGRACIVAPDWLFLGTIYLADLGDGTTAIADGQQRLVTALMIHAAARDLESDDKALAQRDGEVVQSAGEGAAAVPRLHLRSIDAAFFERWVLTPGAMLKPYQHAVDDSDIDTGPALPVLSESQNNILTIRGAIVEKLRSLDAADRRRFMTVLETATEVVVVTAPTVAAALNAYASTHKRGLRQAETDRLKFEIIGDVAPELRTSLAMHWDESEAKLGKDALEDLCGFLLQNKTGVAPPPDVLTGMLEQFTLPERAVPFIETTLVPAAAAYAALLDRGETLEAGTRPGAADRARLRRIQSHLATLMRCTHDDWRGAGIAALLHLRGNLTLLEATLSGLDRLVNLQMLVGQDNHALCRRYGQVVAAIEQGLAGPILAALVPEADLKARAKDQLVSAKFAEKPRYRMPVLLRLNDLIGGAVTTLSAKDVSCEHVLPQNVGKANPAWHELFRNASGKVYNGHLFRHRIGNLAILSHADNRDAGDKPYASKRRIFQASAFAMTRDLAQRHDAWTPAVVQKRSDDLVALLARHWDL